MKALWVGILITLAIAVGALKATAEPGPLCTLGAPNGASQTTLSLSGSTAIVNVQWAFCGTTTTANIHFSNGATFNGATTAQVGLSAGQCISASADIYSGLDGFWTTQAATPSQVCAPSGGGGGGSGGGGGTAPKDTDLDGVADTTDNCVNVKNADQADSDTNGIGDACDGAWAVNSGTGDTTWINGPLGIENQRVTGTNGCAGTALGKYAYGKATFRGAKQFIVFGSRPLLWNVDAVAHICFQPLTNKIIAMNGGAFTVSGIRTPWWSYDNDESWYYQPIGSGLTTATIRGSGSFTGCPFGVPLGCRRVQFTITFTINSPTNYSAKATYSG